MDKKTPARFCIQFNVNDSRHLHVMSILNAQGRHKAQYITSAVLHYINCDKSPFIPQDTLSLRNAVESIVSELLNQNQEKTQGILSSQKSIPMKKVRQSPEIGMDSVELVELDDDTMNAIQESLAAFRDL